MVQHEEGWRGLLLVCIRYVLSRLLALRMAHIDTGFWAATLTLAVLDWRDGKLTHPRDPPFTHPEEPEDLDEEESIAEPSEHRKSSYTTNSAAYDNPYDPSSNATDSPFNDNNRYSGVPSVSTTSYATAPSMPASRPSMDAYGAFSDPPPSGFAPSPPPQNFAPPISPPPGAPSRVMQYATSAGGADPYDAVRSKLNASRTQSPPGHSNPPSYSSSGYPNPYQ